MFTILQKRMKLIFIILLILIAPGFLLFGIGSLVSGRNEKKDVGVVYGKKISKPEYYGHLRAVHTLLFLRFPGQYETIVKFYDMERLVWNRILLAHTVDKYGISVSKKEVQDYIRSFPVFQKEKGAFDLYRYGDIVKQRLGMHPRRFEALMAENLKSEKLLESIGSSTLVFESDIKEYFKELNEEVKIQYFPFRFEKYKDSIEVSDALLEKYLKKNKKRFMVPEKIQVRYLMYGYDDMEKEVTITDDSIREYYDNNKSQYKIVSEEKGEDNSGEESNYKPFEDVKESIGKKLLREKSEKLADEKCRRLFYDALDSHSLVKTAKQKGLEVKTTELFSKQDVLHEIGVSPNFEMAKDFYTEVFQIKKEEITSPIKTTKGVILAERTSTSPEHMPNDLNEVRDEVKKAYIKERSSQLAEKVAGELLDRLKKKKDSIGVEVLLKEIEIKPQVSDFFKKVDSYVKGIGVSKRIMSLAFTLNSGTFSPVVDMPGGVVFFRIMDKKEADFTKFEEQKEDLEKRLVKLKSDRVMQDWMSFIEKEAGMERYSIEEDEKSNSEED